MSSPEALPGERPTAFAPFRHGDFTLYQVARILLILAGQFVILALQVQIYDLTRSKLHLGMIGFAQFLPNVLLSLPAGHLADHLNRRTIVMSCALINAATVALLVWQALLPSPSLVVIYVACVLFGMIRAFSAPAGHAFLPALVPAPLLQKAITWHLATFNLSVLAGPALAGYLYGRDHAARVYGISTALFVAAFVGLALLRARPRPAPTDEPYQKAVSAGVHYVRNDKRLLGAMSLDLFAVLLGGATALIPPFAKDILGRGPEVQGILRSSFAFGAAAMALGLAFHPLRRRIGVWLFGGVAVFGLATVGFGLSTDLLSAVAFLFVGGAADMLSVTVRHTLIQVATPDAMRGRVSAVSMVFINTSNELGEFESGITAHWWGTARAIVVGGVGTVLVVLAWTGLFPSLRKADTFEDKPPGA